VNGDDDVSLFSPSSDVFAGLLAWLLPASQLGQRLRLNECGCASGARSQSRVRRVYLSVPYTPGRRTRYAMPLFIKYSRLVYPPGCHRNFKVGAL
jgi:hypothetical protein